ncbi:MAG TPA: MFS transporter, partial [Clostridia bacterium]
MRFAVNKQLLPLYLIVAAIGLGIGIVIPILPIMFEKSNISPTLIGILTTVMSLGAAAMAVPAGKMVDKYGSQRVMLVGIISFSVVVNLFPYSHSFVAFAVIRFVEGMCWSLVFVPVEAKIMKVSKSETRIRDLSYYAVFNGLGFGLGPVLGAFLIGYGIAYPFVVCSIITFVCGLSSFVIREKKDDTNKVAETVEDKNLYKPLLKWIIAAFVYGMFETGATTMYPLLYEHLGYGKNAMSASLGGLVLGGVLTPLLLSGTASKHGKRKFIVVATGLGAVLAFSLPLVSRSMVMMIPYSVMIGTSAGVMYVISLSVISDMVPVNKLGLANGLFSTGYGISILLGPIISGILFQYVGIRYFYLHTAVLATAYFVL